MTQQEYEQKKRECFVQFCKDNGIDQEVNISIFDAFDQIFDRAFALGREKESITQEEIEKAWQDYAKEIGLPESLNYATKSMIEIAIKQAFKAGTKLNGKQENDAEDTPISERLYEEEKSRLEGIYYYLEGAADKQEDDCVSVAILFEVMERLEDIFGIDLLTNGHMKPTPKDDDTVISGWVCRDKVCNKPFTSDLFFVLEKPTRVVEWGKWCDCGDYIELDSNLFPDLTWESDPEPVEIIIKRKK